MKYTYLILFTLLLGCLGIGLSIHARNSWLKDFSLDIASEIVGILLVIFSVDRVIYAKRKRRKKQKEMVAIQQLKNDLMKHIYFLIELTSYHRETSPNFITKTLIDPQTKSFKEISHLISECQLNFEKLNNFSEFSSEIHRYRDWLNKILAKYSYVLSAEQIHKIENTVNAPLVLLLERINNQASRNSSNNQDSWDNTFATQEDFQVICKDYLNRLCQLSKIYTSDAINDEVI